MLLDEAGPVYEKDAYNLGEQLKAVLLKYCWHAYAQKVL